MGRIKRINTTMKARNAVAMCPRVVFLYFVLIFVLCGVRCCTVFGSSISRLGKVIVGLTKTFPNVVVMCFWG